MPHHAAHNNLSSSSTYSPLLHGSVAQSLKSAITAHQRTANGDVYNILMSPTGPYRESNTFS